MVDIRDKDINKIHNETQDNETSPSSKKVLEESTFEKHSDLNKHEKYEENDEKNTTAQYSNQEKDLASNEEKKSADDNQYLFNTEAEQYLLGSILLNNEIFYLVESFLEDKHFGHIFHIKIYAAMRKLFEKSFPISISTLSSFFHSDKDFIVNNGKEYLSYISSLAIAVVNPKSYANIVYNLFLKRNLVSIGVELVQNAKSPDITLNAIDYIEDTEIKLFNLASQGVAKKEFVHLKSPILSSMQSIELARKDPKAVTGIPSGLIKLDKKLSGFQKSDLIVIAGRPSMGKTALTLNIALNIAKDTTKSVGFFSLEMSAEQLAMRILSVESSIDSKKLKEGNIKEEQYNLLREKSDYLNNTKLFIDETPALSIAQIFSSSRRLKRQHNIDIIFIDYLQLIRGKNIYDTRALEISSITQGLKALAKELNIPVVVASQLSRAVEQREDKRPILSDLRDSGSIEQDADIVIFIYREEYYLSRHVQDESVDPDEISMRIDNAAHISELLIAKHRNGPTGTISIGYDSQLAKFYND